MDNLARQNFQRISVLQPNTTKKNGPSLSSTHARKGQEGSLDFYPHQAVKSTLTLSSTTTISAVSEKAEWGATQQS